MMELMEFDRNGLEILERSDCMQLLGEATIGRLAISSGALPVILPVNFLLDSERILIRTSAGTKLAAALANAVVAFEIDEVDSFTHTGWSVAVTGFAREITDADELARIRRLPLAHWAPTDGHVVAVSTDVVSGRRIRRDVPTAPAR